jgi:localization factor PodJL
MLVAAGVAAVCLAAIGVLFKLHPGPQGISAAQSKVPSPPLSQTAPRHSLTDQRAPLDRLSALARSGDPKAELVIGLKYLAGDGIGADDTEAARWLERAALKGEPVAENALGSLYQSGRGVKLDVGQAMHWYESAAMLGDRHAMSNLAVLYASGVAGTKNLAEAARWFQRSADLGYVDAQFNLAVLFERGDGVPQSLLDAYKWYAIAAAAGDQVARTRADAIATQVSAEELQAAEHAVAEFKPLPLNRAANQVPTMAAVLAAR